MHSTELLTYTAMRYVQPLREGGSLPAIVDTDGGGLFVVKFRGAGQGARALVAELVVGLLARELGLPVPDLALIEIPAEFGRSEPDPEIQDILKASHGTNVGLRYLDGAFNFDGHAAGDLIAPSFAADLVWFDAFLTNPDRTHRNPNLLIWNRQPSMIDHGAALYAHHNWASVDDERTRGPFPLIRDHVLLTCSEDIAEADDRLAPAVTAELLTRVMNAVPDDLLITPLTAAEFASAGEARERYQRYLRTRLEPPRSWVAEAIRARADRLRSAPRAMSARR